MSHLLEKAGEDDRLKAIIFTAANRIAKTKKYLLGSWPKPWKKIDMLFETIGCQQHLATIEKIENGGFEGKDPTARS